MDRKTGKIKAWSGDQEIHSSELAVSRPRPLKQVVIQKIREAEKDVVFGEYNARDRSDHRGSVYRFERGNITVDLGKSEALDT